MKDAVDVLNERIAELEKQNMSIEQTPRRSKRWQFAILGAAMGGLVAVAIALAFRPQIIQVGSCCCCQAPCTSGKSAQRPIGKGPALGKGEIPVLPPRAGTVPEAPGAADRDSRLYALPWVSPEPFSSFGGPGEARKNTHQVPVPGTLALVALGGAVFGLRS